MESKSTNKQSRLALFEEELSLITLPGMRRWTEDCLLLAPDYMFEISASDSGYHHPPWSLGPGGLVRHTKAVALLAYMLSGTFYNTGDSAGSGDILTRNTGIVSAIISASILHDSCKYGIPFDYRMGTLHPYIPRVYFNNVAGSLTGAERNYIFTLIESHMGSYENGSWSPISKLTRETLASNPAALILHTADYLASRENYVDARFIDLDEAVIGHGAHVPYDPFPDHIIKGLVYGIASAERSEAEVAAAMEDKRLEAVCDRVKRLRSPRSVRTAKYNYDGVIASIRENLNLIISPAVNTDDVGDANEQSL